MRIRDTKAVYNHVAAPPDFRYFLTRDGVKLYYQPVEPTGETRGMLISLQGINGGGIKGVLNENLAKKGIASYIIHQRGTGYSEGLSGDIDSFEKVVKDYQEFITILRKRHPNTPLILIGHSIGGAFCLRLAEEIGVDSLDGLVLINPATKFSTHSSISLSGRVQFIFNYIFRPHALVINATPDKVMSNTGDRESVEKTLQEKLSLKKMSPHYAVALTKLMAVSVKRAKSANVPLLLVLGGEDQIIDHRVTKEVYNGWKNPTKTMRIYPDDGHAGAIFDDSLELVLEWIDLHCNKATKSEPA